MASFNEREQKQLAAAFLSLESEPKLDMEKFSQHAGLTVGSARNAWAALKKKIYAADEPSSSTKGATTKTPAKSARKRPASIRVTAYDYEASDGEVTPTPSKKPKTPKKGKGKGKTKAKVVDSDDEDSDGMMKVKEEVAVETDADEV